MTQLNINGQDLPETRHDKYQAYLEPKTVQVEMANHRTVEELSGYVYHIAYAYDYMGNDDMRSLLTALRSGAITATFLPDDSDTPVTRSCVLEKLTQPKCAWSRDGVLLWHDFAFTLRSRDPEEV